MSQRSWIIWVLAVVLLIGGTSAAKVSCVKCSSADNTNCAAGTVTATECTTDDDKCYSRVNGDNVERGCLHDLVAADQTKCETPTDLTCVACTGTGCNKDAWLKCHKCEGTTCYVEQPEDSTTKFCAKFSAEDVCYSKVEVDKVQRGCKSDLTDFATECTAFKYCETCTGNACNKLSGDVLKTYKKCLQCDSSAANCVDVTATATECALREDLCYTRVANSVLQRGCLSRLTEAEQTVCSKADDTTCVTCSTDGCNNESWLKCYQCQETTTAACAQEQTAAAPFCKNWKSYNQCFERLESAKMVRGCETDLAATAEPCKDNQKCRTCTKDGCNKAATATLESTERCVQCDTDKVECLKGTAANEPCAKASENKCYSRVNADGVLTRGCKGDLTAADVTACTGKACNICEGVGCNKDVFPTDRLSCYQCKTTDSDKTCSDQLTGESKAAYCKKYKEGDQCYTRILDGIFERGCQSDLAKTACDGLKDTECQSCSGENCNGVSEEKLKNAAGLTTVSSLLLALSSLVVALNALN
ncbi:uncharacterized protein LOC129724012 [Wyeomyia smithii]|uniref:uncharacterized protein LOC129724012 n=1 Tax=Wyeomyia smithii TaxID=174621 RepID=UPI0024680B6C|nr:uncharacterized protein LOC129724012 [Wyeomyia smithii]